jgi:alpha/beta superfamily hydrolase
MPLPGDPVDTLVVEAVCFPSSCCHLEGQLAYAETADRGGVVLAGPHPLLGGTMTNNVVRGVGDGLASLGRPTLRFNYRGVGGSSGPRLYTVSHLAEFWRTSHIPEELAFRNDLAAAIDWFRRTLGQALPFAVVGYSFGCSLLPWAVPDPATPLVLIAPTVGTHDYTAFACLTNPLLVVASEDDFAADTSQVRAWFDRLTAPRRLTLGRHDNHFFRGHEPWLVETIHTFLEETWGCR